MRYGSIFQNSSLTLLVLLAVWMEFLDDLFRREEIVRLDILEMMQRNTADSLLCADMMSQNAEIRRRFRFKFIRDLMNKEQQSPAEEIRYEQRMCHRTLINEHEKRLIV